jgi:predicted dehydrogenase
VDLLNERSRRLAAFAKGAVAATAISELVDRFAPVDLVVCAVGAGEQIEVLTEALDLKPSVVVCEKPFGLVAEEARELAAMYRARGVRLLINYQRRYDTTCQSLAQLVGSGQRGRLQMISAVYSRGLFNNGVHVIDFVHQIAGFGQVMAAREAVIDPTGDSSIRHVDFEMQTAVCPRISIRALPVDGLSVWEVQLFFEHGSVTMHSGGRSVATSVAEKSAVLSGALRLGEVSCQAGTVGTALAALYDSVVSGEEMIIGGLSAADAAVRTLEVAESIARLALR